MRKKEALLSRGSSLGTGVILLTVANLLVKVLGFVYKVPLNTLLGDEMANVNAAAALFAVLYTATTAGIPGALSLSVARARAAGDALRIRTLVDTTLGVLLGVGFLLSFALLLFAHPLAALSGDGGGFLCTVAIAPALFFTAATSVFRGFFQGFSRLAPTAVSALLEAVGKAVFGVVFAYLCLHAFGKSTPVAAAFAVFGITLGVLLGALFLAIRYRKEGSALLLSVSVNGTDSIPSRREALRGVFTLALPITLSAALMSLSGLIDARMMRPLLSTYFGDEALAKAIYSDYSTGALTLYNMPAVLITPIATALIPYVSGAVASGRVERARRVTATALKLASVLSLPCAFGLSVLSGPILRFVFRSDTNMAENAGPSLSVLSACVFFAALLTVSSAALQTVRHERLPLVSLGVGVAVKLLLMSPLVRAFGTVGVPLATVAFYGTATVWNLVFLYRTARLRMHLFDGLLRPALAAALTGLSARAAYALLLPRVGSDASLLFAIVFAALLYSALLFLLRAVGKEELSLLPFARFALKKKKRSIPKTDE